jgi:hypothetical protein
VRNILKTLIKRAKRDLMIKVFILFCFLLALNISSYSQDAPVTTVGRITDATPGDTNVQVDITVIDFIDIGQFTLTIKFDTLKIKYISSTTNPALPGMTVTYTPPSGNSQGKLLLSWTGASNTSLDDSSTLTGLVFHYVEGTGLLNWAYTYGSVCEYKRYVNSALTLLNDTPRYQFYLNGGISDRSAPIIFAPIVKAPEVGSLPITITVSGFSEIGSFTLYLEYDPGIISYLNTFTKNPAFDSNFQVGDNPGFGDMRFIVIQWYGGSVTLTDGSTLCSLDFNYPEAVCEISLLSWYDSGPSCEFTDAPGDVLIDMPANVYYKDGIVQAGLPSTWNGNNGSDWSDPDNWSGCGLPDFNKKVVVPDVSPNAFPVITDTAECKSIEIENGAVITISANGKLLIGN